MSETKTKYAIYLYPSQMEEIKSLMEQANAKSQSEFVSDAIRFYIGYLQQGKNVNYLAPIIAQCIREEISSTEVSSQNFPSPPLGASFGLVLLTMASSSVSI